MLVGWQAYETGCSVCGVMKDMPTGVAEAPAAESGETSWWKQHSFKGTVG